MRSRVRAYLATFGFWLAYFWAARLLFLVYHAGMTGGLPPAEVAGTFVHGFRLDASGAAYLTAVTTLLLMLSTVRPLERAAFATIGAWTTAVAVIGAVVIAADLEIFRQWDRRIDAGILPYLATPKEAWASAGASPRLLLALLAAAFGGGAAWAYRRWILRPLRTAEPLHPLWSLPSVLLIGFLVVPARGGVQLIPVGVGSAYFSPRPFANFAAQNALWGFLDSFTHRQHDRVNHYVSSDPAAAEASIAAARAPAGPARPAPVGRPKPNILLIIWESASARAVGSLGGRPGVTPAFDSLARDGILFRRFYAAGDRTDKGIASLLSSFPALPVGSILTVPQIAGTLPKVSEDFRRAGYRTSFYYGGALDFASLKAYLVDSKFDRVVGKSDFPRSSWNSKWGAHDGVVATRLIEDLKATETPFFSVWLTLSSHEPFETPDPPSIPGGDWQSRYFNSLAYTDRVIGKLVAEARRQPWWKETLVVIVADHGRRVIPLDDAAPFKDADAIFRIPMLWLGGALTARDSTVDEIGSQLDLAPTLLAVAGVPGAHPYRWGRSLLDPVARPFAYYGFETGFGLVTPSGNLVFDPRAGRFVTRIGTPTPDDERLGQALLQLTYQDYLDR